MYCCVILHPPRQPRIKNRKIKEKERNIPKYWSRPSTTVKSITPSPLPQQLPQSNQPKSTSTISQWPLHPTSVLKLFLDPSRISLLLLETRKFYTRTGQHLCNRISGHIMSLLQHQKLRSSQHFLRRAASWDPYPVPVYILFHVLLSIAFNCFNIINHLSSPHWSDFASSSFLRFFSL